MTPAVRIAGALICVSLVAAASAVAAPRLHRTKLPPPPPLPTSLAIDETEWKVVPSKTVVAAGRVTLRVYNRGMDRLLYTSDAADELTLVAVCDLQLFEPLQADSSLTDI